MSHMFGRMTTRKKNHCPRLALVCWVVAALSGSHFASAHNDSASLASSSSSSALASSASLVRPPSPLDIQPGGGGGGSPNIKSRGRDSLSAFQRDVTTVLKELRADKFDPTVPAMFHAAKRPTFAVTWTHQMWANHTSRWRFLNNFFYWTKSALLKRILPQLTGLMIWTHFAMKIVDQDESVLTKVKFPMTSLSLVSGFVASMLALRSNQGLSRLLEARQNFGKVVHYTRDMSSLVAHFVYPHHPDLGLKLARHLCCFSWLLRGFLRGRKSNGGNDEDLVRTLLSSQADADYVLSQRKTPVAIVMRLRQALAHLSHAHALTTAEEMAIDHTIQAMDTTIMLCERLVASPIPPLFTTHAGRLLTFYLFALPIALHSGGALNKWGTYATVFAVGYAMLGLDEISHLMEQPFKLAPLYHLCKNSMKDIADSFLLPCPSLDDRKNGRYALQTPQPYWPDGDATALEESD